MALEALFLKIQFLHVYQFEMPSHLISDIIVVMWTWNWTMDLIAYTKESHPREKIMIKHLNWPPHALFLLNFTYLSIWDPPHLTFNIFGSMYICNNNYYTFSSLPHSFLIDQKPTVNFRNQHPWRQNLQIIR